MQGGGREELSDDAAIENFVLRDNGSISRFSGFSICNANTLPFLAPRFARRCRSPLSLSLSLSQLACQRKLTDGTYNPKRDRVCYDLLDKIVAATRVGGRAPSQYDNRMWVKSQVEFPPGKARLEQYLGNSDASKRTALMSQIHAQKNPFGSAESKWGQLTCM